MRSCYRSSLLAAASFTCLLSGSSLVSSAAATSDRVLVIGAHEDLVHDAIATTPSAFSPAGLAQLAMDAMRLSTGKIVHLSSDSAEQLTVQSPAQADVFKHVDAYAMVYVDSADAAVLNTVNAAAQSGYHKVFDLTADAAAGPSTKIPAVLARALQQSVGAELLCAGSATVCQSDVLPAVDVTQAQLEDMFAKHVFLDSTNAADKTLARELAQTQQLTAAILFKTKVPSALYAVQFSSISALSASKQSRARDAVASQIQELLSALQTVYPRNSGAQIVALTGAAAVPSLVKLDAVTAFSRMLLAFSDPVASSLDQDEDDDDTTTTVNGTTTSNVTIEDIAEYQIILWTSVMLGAVLILVIIAMCNMAPKRDSLLYAKFTTSNGSRKFD